MAENSQYPDPEDSSRMPSFAWLGENSTIQNLSDQDHDSSTHSGGSSRARGPLHSQHLPTSNHDLEKAKADFDIETARKRIEGRNDTDNYDFLQGLGTEQDAEISDADSDYLEHQADMVKFKQSVLKFRAAQRDESSGNEDESAASGDDAFTPTTRSGRGRGRWSSITRGGRAGRGRGGPRGPRKAAEPTGDIKLRLSRASEAFIKQDYDEARQLVSEVIRINAETYEAWTLLATIFEEIGDTNKALMALMYAAHLRPRDVNAWLNCARFALEETGEHRAKYVPSALFCYSSALRADSKNLDARYGKAALHMEQGNTNFAISEYKIILSRRPQDTSVLRSLAEAYIDQDQAEIAKDLYVQSIANFKITSANLHDMLSWSDVNIYIELYGYLGQYDEAIKELKSISRWMVGRQTEDYWDNITDNDCEWDCEDSRRVEIPQFVAGRFPRETYGLGLPLELRVKLGLYRLQLSYHDEAMHHLNFLDPLNTSSEDKVQDYPDLFREAADQLLASRLHKEALTFYEPLKSIAGQSDALLQVQLGICYLRMSMKQQAEECFQTAIQIDENNIEARIQLAKLYEELNEQKQAFIYVNEVMSLRRAQGLASSENDPGTEGAQTDAQYLMTDERPRKSQYKPRRLANPVDRLKDEAARAEQLHTQYLIMQSERGRMRDGNEEAMQAWMDAAGDLVDDFRSCKTFYPWDKYVHFLGYSRDSKLQAQTPLDSDISAMADRLSQNLGASSQEGSKLSQTEIPADYRGIAFSVWLDIFLEYAICLARVGKGRDSYEICEAAKDAIVFYHSREDMFLIHVCWCTCALLTNDEETCVSVARFFMKDYQFTTDSYRMFGAITRICQSPISWYNSGPTQKYILRQIKAMDFALVDDAQREKYFAEKGSYSAQDEKGQVIVNDDMDIALLMLYGHILYSGTSYAYALNYFFRALALDPTNPVIHLNIGLAYIHYSLKRQAENRQHLIMQGFTFLFRYYEQRRQSSRIEERQEAHFNIARAYNMLGLSNLAAPYYLRVLEEIEASGGQANSENFELEAAYNLQAIYVAGGNQYLARNITERWLVV
ncbi:hypothetical protein F5884DRAFT_852241 [Xylogone sp. PMI_703]|nr:hypothetical protein F5884DRAFT_852241 [Xylogone sp. PMI_703]